MVLCAAVNDATSLCAIALQARSRMTKLKEIEMKFLLATMTSLTLIASSAQGDDQ